MKKAVHWINKVTGNTSDLRNPKMNVQSVDGRNSHKPTARRLPLCQTLYGMIPIPDMNEELGSGSALWSLCLGKEIPQVNRQILANSQCIYLLGVFAHDEPC